MLWLHLKCADNSVRRVYVDLRPEELHMCDGDVKLSGQYIAMRRDVNTVTEVCDLDNILMWEEMSIQWLRYVISTVHWYERCQYSDLGMYKICLEFERCIVGHQVMFNAILLYLMQLLLLHYLSWWPYVLFCLYLCSEYLDDHTFCSVCIYVQNVSMTIHSLLSVCTFRMLHDHTFYSLFIGYLCSLCCEDIGLYFSPISVIRMSQ